MELALGRENGTIMDRGATALNHTKAIRSQTLHRKICLLPDTTQLHLLADKPPNQPKDKIQPNLEAAQE